MKLFILFFFIIGHLVFAQDVSHISLSDSLPVDSAVVSGVFNNGLRYYIRQNKEPHKRAELRLVVKAGSILEDDDQQGLAHFNEHMAFNGSENFKKHALVDFLEKSGMRFGADVNAYTGFDKTVYMLQLPTDSLWIFQKGFQVLEDWAHRLSFDPVEIDKERGVVIEEWRRGRGANARIRDKQFPVLFKGSRYADRLPIGKKKILESFMPRTLIHFYKQWYRPDLMAVVAVGDFDVTTVKKWIRLHFAGLKNPVGEIPRINYSVPGHDNVLYSIVTDPEARYTRLSINTQIPVKVSKTVADYRHEMVKGLYTTMLNNRLFELLQNADPPYLYAVSGESRIVHGASFYTVDVVVKNAGLPLGLSAAIREIERVRRFGFTETELAREKKSTMRGMEQAWREMDKRKSRRLVSEYIRAFSDDEPIPGLNYEYALYKKFIPSISLKEVNAVGQSYASAKNQVILVSMPDKKGLAPPTEKSLHQIRAAALQAPIAAYKDATLDKPIVAQPRGNSPVLEEKTDEQTGVSEWRLANGVKVVLKPTDFKNDQVLFTASSPGGTSLVPLADLPSAQAADDLAEMSGLGNYNAVDLQKYLADRVVTLSPYIGSLYEGFNGSAAPQDLEMLFQMVYAQFTAARFDTNAYLSYQKRMRGILQNRGSQPGSVFSDTLTAILTRHNPRFKPMQENDIDKIILFKAGQIFKQRFADGNDFTFFFVGNFTLQSIRPLVEKYLGSLPVLQGSENWRDVTYRYPKGVISKNVRKGMEAKGRSVLVFTGPAKWDSMERIRLSALSDILRIKLRERLREDKGGTYSVGVRGALQHFPLERYKLTISFGADPTRLDELQKDIFAQIDSLKNFKVDLEYLQKVKETELRSFELSRRENSYWLYNLKNIYINNLPLASLLDYPERVRKLTIADVREAARKYLNVKNYIRLDLYPSEKKDREE